MAEDFDLYRQFGVTSPEQREAANMALITTGLGMLAGANQPRYPGQGVFGNVAQGALGGMQAYGDYRQQQAAIAQAQQLQAMRQQQMQMQLAEFEREQDKRQAMEAYISSIDDPNMQASIRAVGPQAIRDLIQAQAMKAPTGFRRGPGDTLIPGMVDMGDGRQMSYADLRLAEAQARAQMPGYGEPERLQMASEAAMRADRAEARAERSEERAQQAAARANMLMVPTKIEDGYIGNNATIDYINQAISAVRANPDSFGLKFAGGTYLNSKIDPAGVKARAIVADVGSQKVHDRAGTAQSYHEMQRLRPIIPEAWESPDKIIKNLELLRDHAIAQNKAMRERYSNPEKYRNFLEVGGAERDTVLMQMEAEGEGPRGRGPEEPAGASGGWKIEEVK